MILSSIIGFLVTYCLNLNSSDASTSNIFSKFSLASLSGTESVSDVSKVSSFDDFNDSLTTARIFSLLFPGSGYGFLNFLNHFYNTFCSFLKNLVLFA